MKLLVGGRRGIGRGNNDFGKEIESLRAGDGYWLASSHRHRPNS
jgi:hypothetical protein